MTWNLGDAGLVSTENLVSGVNMAETTASGSQTSHDRQHPKESTDMSRRGRSKSPHGRTGRELSLKSCTVEMRARMARVRQMKLTSYLPALPPPPLHVFEPRDTVMQEEADATLGELQRQIGDATHRTNALIQAVVQTHQKAQEAGRIAVSGATGVAQTNASLEKMLVELHNKLHYMRTKIEGAEEQRCSIL